MAANDSKDVGDEKSTTTATPSETKLFTRLEVAKHTSSKDAWIIIHNSVYNVASFLNEHPGGEEVLLEQSGNDGTEAFEDIGHSSDARGMMGQFKIGELVEAERINDSNKKKTDWSSKNTDEDNFGGSWRSWVIPIALGVLATLVYRYFITSH